MDRKLICISCKREINEGGTVTFKCPKCGDFQITRCRHCREIASKYICPRCSFSGPN